MIPAAPLPPRPGGPQAARKARRVGASVTRPDGREAAPSPSGDGALSPAPDRLYMDVRDGQRPVDPLTWFATDKG